MEASKTGAFIPDLFGCPLLCAECPSLDRSLTGIARPPRARITTIANTLVPDVCRRARKDFGGSVHRACDHHRIFLRNPSCEQIASESGVNSACGHNSK